MLPSYSQQASQSIDYASYGWPIARCSTLTLSWVHHPIIIIILVGGDGGGIDSRNKRLNLYEPANNSILRYSQYYREVKRRIAWTRQQQKTAREACATSFFHHVFFGGGQQTTFQSSTCRRLIVKQRGNNLPSFAFFSRKFCSSQVEKIKSIRHASRPGMRRGKEVKGNQVRYSKLDKQKKNSSTSKVPVVFMIPLL